MKLRLKFEPLFFFLSTRDTPRARVALVENQDEIGHDEHQVTITLQHIGALGVLVHHRSREDDQQKIGLCGL